MSDLSEFARDLERLVERLVEKKVDERLAMLLGTHAALDGGHVEITRPEWVDYQAAAEVLGISYGTLRGWVVSDRYSIRKLTKGEGRLRRFHRPSLEAFDPTRRK